MKRRESITLVGGAAAAWPVAARAQPTTAQVIGVLGIGSVRNSGRLVDAVRQGLNEAGYVEGRNVAIEQRWAEGDYKQLPLLAADLSQRRVSVIVGAGGTASALAAKAATETIPIVFQVAVDPVAAGLVASLDRPGNNLTGVSNLASELGPKRLELLREFVPTAKSIALLVNPTNKAVSEVAIRTLQTAAADAVQLHVLHASNEQQLALAFKNLSELGVGGLVVVPDLTFVDRIEYLAALTLRHSMPAIFQFREFAAGGGLMSYGGNVTDAYREVGRYVARILKGNYPSDMPVQQFTKIELVINLKTAKTFGIPAPQIILARADEVIE